MAGLRCRHHQRSRSDAQYQELARVHPRPPPRLTGEQCVRLRVILLGGYMLALAIEARRVRGIVDLAELLDRDAGMTTTMPSRPSSRSSAS